jgi:hypothetical protein
MSLKRSVKEEDLSTKRRLRGIPLKKFNFLKIKTM